MVTWDRVTRAHVLRAIKDYDRLGPERFFFQAWMSSPRANGLPPVTSRAGRQAP
jgi:hypothetical protein